MADFDRYTYEAKPNGGFYLYGWSVYPQNSVLAGQPMKRFLDSFGQLDQLLAVQPAAQPGSRFTDPVVNLNHLPDENDPVPGGMFPDDWD